MKSGLVKKGIYVRMALDLIAANPGSDNKRLFNRGNFPSEPYLTMTLQRLALSEEIALIDGGWYLPKDIPSQAPRVTGYGPVGGKADITPKADRPKLSGAKPRSEYLEKVIQWAHLQDYVLWQDAAKDYVQHFAAKYEEQDMGPQYHSHLEFYDPDRKHPRR